MQKSCRRMVYLIYRNNREKCNENNITYSPIKGGITNLLYHICYGNLEVLLRIFGTNTEYIINRDNEISIFLFINRNNFTYFSTSFCSTIIWMF